ncbi:hypothetical protein HKCCE3408_01330 [Rhodobacterales bacterium HKCCE3408]|nr:hypothetical protein [Rhodobacterales bacterium HKCCE3408]
MRTKLIAALAALTLWPQVSLAQECQVIDLPAGFEAGALEGVAPVDGVVCFDLRFPRGQNLSIELASGQNVSVSVPGYYDDRPDRMFLGDLPGELEIRVFQLMRSPTSQPFTLNIRFEQPGNG